MVYFIAFLLAAIGAFYNNKLQPGARKTYLAIICLYLIIILGLRYRVGVDTINYIYNFREVKPLSHFFSTKIFQMRMEPGFLFVCSLSKTLGGGFTMVQFIIGAITNICTFIFLYRYCRNVFIGVIIFLFLQWFYFTMEIMREGTAIAIFLLNYRNLEKKRWILYYIMTIPSLLFHYSAAIVWFFPLAYFLKLNYKFFILCGAILLVSPLLEKLSDMLSFLMIAKRFDSYVKNAAELNFNFMLMENVKINFPALATLAAYCITKVKCRVEKMLLLHIILSLGIFAIPLLFSRFTNYTTMFVTVALANILCSDYISRSLRVMLICFTILTQAFYYSHMYPRWFPYNSIFDPQKNHRREQIWKHDFITWR